MEMPRLCHDGDLSMLQEHLASINKKSNQKLCEVCGRSTGWECDICKKPMCTTDGKWKWNGAQCAVTFHNPSFWGLALSDVHLHRIKKEEWRPPTSQMMKRNQDKVAALRTELMRLRSAD